MTALAARIAGLAICLSFVGFTGCGRNTVSATARIEVQEASDADRARAPPGECEWACPDHGEKFRAALADAVGRADRIVVTEHSSPFDATDEIAHEPLTQQEFVYETVTLNAGQRQQFLTAIEQLDPTTQTWASACVPLWHHTVRFYQEDQLASTLRICFECSHVFWDDMKNVTNPESIHKTLRTFIADLELRPERDWESLARAQLAAR